MAAATINLKKSNLKKALVKMKITGVKPKSMVAVGDDIITEVDYKNPKDLYEAGNLEGITGSEFKVDELIGQLLPDGKK